LPASGETTPGQLVIDAGPLIALFHEQDRDHAAAIRGFAALRARRSLPVVPLPILFEVYKWLVYHGGHDAAQLGLREMRAVLSFIEVRVEELEALAALTASVRGWHGTLEDAAVALTALRLRVPVWTLNYRDLSVFPRLSFWNP